MDIDPAVLEGGTPQVVQPPDLEGASANGGGDTTSSETSNNNNNNNKGGNNNNNAPAGGGHSAVNQLMDNNVNSKGQNENAILTTSGDVGSSVAGMFGFNGVASAITTGAQIGELAIDELNPITPPPTSYTQPIPIAPTEQGAPTDNVNSGANTLAGSIETSNAPVFTF